MRLFFVFLLRPGVFKNRDQGLLIQAIVFLFVCCFFVLSF